MEVEDEDKNSHKVEVSHESLISVPRLLPSLSSPLLSSDVNRISVSQGAQDFLVSSARILPDRKCKTRTVEYTVQEAQELGFFNVEAILKDKYQQGWRFLVKWENFPLSSSTWEPIKCFMLPQGKLNSVFRKYCVENGLDELIKKFS